jgi:hypothetical protein
MKTYHPKKNYTTTTINNYSSDNISGDGSPPEFNILDSACSTSNVDETFLNYENILQSHLIDSIVKDGVDSSLFWSLVDPSKLAAGVKSFMSAIQKQRSTEEAERLSALNIVEEIIELPEGAKSSAFPALCNHGIPFTKSSIHAILRDILKLSQLAPNSKLLIFPSFSGRLYTLIQVPLSSNYYRFARNARESRWIQSALLASAGRASEEAKETAACFLLTYLGKIYEDAFAFSATKLGLLLKPKVMDAESAEAMWQEANCPIHAQCIILRHLFNHFGRRINVP